MTATDASVGTNPIVIRGGTVVDGTGSPGFVADVAVQDGLIVAVGPRLLDDPRYVGATVIDADELARDAVRPGSAALNAIVSRWGKRVLNADGSLNRAALRALVFSSDTERQALNAIVHPEVKRLRD